MSSHFRLFKHLLSAGEGTDKEKGRWSDRREGERVWAGVIYRNRVCAGGDSDAKKRW